MRWARGGRSAATELRVGRAEDGLYFLTDLRKACLGRRLEAYDDDRAGVRGPHERPGAIRVADADAVDLGRLVLSTEVVAHRGDDRRLHVVGAIHADLRRGDGLRQVGEE